MSFILDALKKSAKDRHRGSLPDMLTVQDIVIEKPRKRFRLSYLLIAALFLNAGLLAWWLAFSHTAKTKDEQTAKGSPSLVIHDAAPEIPGAARPSAGPSLPAVSELKPGGRSFAPLIEDGPSGSSVKDRLGVKKPSEVTAAQRDTVPHQPAAVNNAYVMQESSPVKAKQAEAAGAPSLVLDENKIYRLSELPQSILKDLPAISISALLYANDPPSRMVSVNNHMMYEGEYLTGGVRVEEITRDGVIFRYKEIRFLVGLK